MLVRILFVFASLVLLNSCSDQRSSQLERISERQQLRVATLFSPISYNYSAPNEASGFDYDLAQDFASYLGVELVIIPKFSQSELIAALVSDEVDIVAAGLLATPQRLADFRYSPPLYYSQPIVIGKEGAKAPEDWQSLGKQLLVVQGGGAEQLLYQLRNEHKDLRWSSTVDTDEAEILRTIAEGDGGFTLGHQRLLDYYKRFFPHLTTVKSIGEPLPAVWLMAKNNDSSLHSAVVSFIGVQQQEGTLVKLTEKYFGHLERFDFVDVRAFLQRAEEKLPRYAKLFQKYAGDFDWRLIAAIAYQESHWDPKATSPTGVRGMMMLTNATAKVVGVTDRTDAEQSIKGGSDYLRLLVERMPETIPQDEKIWFALASYNMGFAHLLDARRLATMRGADPDSWADVKQQIPLLAQKNWYSKTRYGYARGYEAYRYVENIRQYYQSLIWFDQQQQHQLLFPEQPPLFEEGVNETQTPDAEASQQNLVQ